MLHKRSLEMIRTQVADTGQLDQADFVRIVRANVILDLLDGIPWDIEGADIWGRVAVVCDQPVQKLYKNRLTLNGVMITLSQRTQLPYAVC